MLLWLTPCSAYPRRRLGQRHQPGAQAVGLERRDLQVAQLRIDEGAEAVARVSGRLTVGFEKLKITLACCSHSERSDDPGRRMLPLNQPGADFRLRLWIIQHHHAIGVGEVVRGADL